MGEGLGSVARNAARVAWRERSRTFWAAWIAPTKMMVAASPAARRRRVRARGIGELTAAGLLHFVAAHIAAIGASSSEGAVRIGTMRQAAPSQMKALEKIASGRQKPIRGAARRFQNPPFTEDERSVRPTRT